MIREHSSAGPRIGILAVFHRYSLALPGLLAAAAGIARAEVPVEVARAAERPIVQVVQVSGTVTSPRSAVLSPSVAGLIAAMAVDAGDRVAAGDVLVELDDELAALVLAREEASFAQARAALEDSRRRLEEAERVGVTQAIAASQIRSLASEVLQDEAQLAAARAAAAEQRAIVARHRVKAPFDGVISQRLSEIGEWANPGDALVELVATDDLRFDFRVPQEYYGRLVRDMRVELRSDAVPGAVIDGRIQAIVPIKDPGARTFLLRVVADGAAPMSLTPGISARGSLHIDTQQAGVVVDRDALLRYPDGRQVVWVVDMQSELPKVSERQVQVGLLFDGLAEIRAGLEAGETVVTRGNESLQDGQAVTIQAGEGV